MKIGLGCDHGGYNLKLEIKKYLGTKGIEWCRILEQIMNTESVDYPILRAKSSRSCSGQRKLITE